ncbi:DHH phosphoesterase [Sparassis crispa]|uniref:DHH phosphoesterase n=1 Tax=Sparassis crispa TaxID=139825 RepID=A0A401GME1_9APHY|nr:DHH phosphoesterase [Sparassis crispa]GBE83411.1 DHH phosphoesterase [Sparassis crispa]
MSSMDLREPSPSDASDALSEFLSRQKERYLDAVARGTAGEWTVVMGNEAGDLDSLASAIAYAYYAGVVSKHAPTIPLVQTPREDLHLRAENLHALALAGVDPALLLTISDLPSSSSSSPFPSTKFVLVDHNRLAPAFSHPSARVVAVVDHHADEGLYADTADPRLIEVPTGSCASIVARLLQHTGMRIPRELATLLLCSILVDTGGLKPGGKAEDADRAAAAFLAPLSTLSLTCQNEALIQTETQITTQDASSEELHAVAPIQALNATLQTRKASVAHLGTRDLLRRDYKEYTYTLPRGADVCVGLASVPVGLHAWLSREPGGAFGTEAEAWMRTRELDVLGVLTSFRDAESEHSGKSGRGKHRREQLYVVRDKALAETLFSGLEESEELKLKRRKWKDYDLTKEKVGFGGDVAVRVWKQKNVDATRKTTAPLVKSIIEGEGRGKGASL